ncbi:MAG: hypothetical protein ACRED3_10060 [Bradyrhizobium sp.]
MPTEKTDRVKNRLRGNEYIATPEELRVIDAAMPSIDAGEVATTAEMQAVFAKFRSE